MNRATFALVVGITASSLQPAIGASDEFLIFRDDCNGYTGPLVVANADGTSRRLLPRLELQSPHRCPPSWARLISKVYQADTLVCKAAQLRSRSWRTSPTSCPSGASWTIWASSPPEQEKPPPRREVVLLPVDDEGREILAG